jgi:hypothetical protein
LILNVVLVVGCSSLIASCDTVGSTGLAGVGIDEEGDLVGSMQICGHQLDAATLYRTRDSEHLGRWRAVPPVIGFTSFSMEAPNGGWAAEQGYSPPSGDDEYGFYGGTFNNTWSASTVAFHLSDLAGMKPGEVLYEHLGKLVRGSRTQFQHDACSTT